MKPQSLPYYQHSISAMQRGEINLIATNARQEHFTEMAYKLDTTMPYFKRWLSSDSV